MAKIVEKPIRSTVACGVSLLTLGTLGIGRSADLFEDILDVKEVVNEQCSLQVRDSLLGQGGGLATVGAFYYLSQWSLACQWFGHFAQKTWK